MMVAEERIVHDVCTKHGEQSHDAAVATVWHNRFIKYEDHQNIGINDIRARTRCNK